MSQRIGYCDKCNFYLQGTALVTTEHLKEFLNLRDIKKENFFLCSSCGEKFMDFLKENNLLQGYYLEWLQH